MNLFGPGGKPQPFSFRPYIVYGLFFIGVALGGLFWVSWQYPHTLTEIAAVTSNVISGKNSLVTHREKSDVVLLPVFISPPSLPVLTGVSLSESAFTAKSILVKDVETGMLLYKKNPYEQTPIASVTKLMSALVIMDAHPDWSKNVTVTGAELFDSHITPGKTYILSDLWRAALITSSNRAIATVADNVGYTRDEFVQRMNTKAHDLGMTDAVFVEPTGLDEGNRASASDALILMNEALKVPFIKETVLMKEYTFVADGDKKSTHIWNTDWLLLGWVPGNTITVLGGKTGYIPESGYNFVARLKDAKDHAIDVAVFGARTPEARFTEARDVALWTFANYTWPDDLGKNISPPSTTIHSL